MSRLRMIAVLLAALLLAAGCATFPQHRVSVADVPAAQRERAARNLRVFHAVWDLVNRKHYLARLEGVDWQHSAAVYGKRAAAAPDDQVLFAVLNEMLDELRDSHTRALTPEQAAERRSRQRARTGFAMTRVENHWVVTDVVPESPAGREGVTPGWLVLKRNGEALGPRPDYHPREGEHVTWEFMDARNRLIPLTLEARQLSTLPLQVERDLPGGYVYLRFDEFDRRNRRWLDDQLRQHRRSPGVVLDLRRNSGGGTISLGIMIGEFFNRSVSCGTFITRTGARSEKTSWQLGSAHYPGKVVVLIEAGSASAAEILAAVLQEHGRATLVGRKTAGAVLASWFYRLPGGGALQLSREDYLTPKGRRIEGHGVEPDVVVTRSLADIRAGRDPDLAAALQVLEGRSGRESR